MARQIDRALPAPARDEGVERVDVAGNQPARRTPSLQCKETPDAGADGLRQPQQRRPLNPPRTELAPGLGYQVVERIGVLTEQIGRTCQCRNRSRSWRPSSARE